MKFFVLGCILWQGIFWKCVEKLGRARCQLQYFWSFLCCISGRRINARKKKSWNHHHASCNTFEAFFAASMGEESMQEKRRVGIITTPTPPPTRTKSKISRHQCGSDAAFHNVLQRYMECESVCCCICLLSGCWGKTHLSFVHSLTFDSQSRVCNSCVFNRFSHLGDRKTLILTIKKTRTRTFK